MYEDVWSIINDYTFVEDIVYGQLSIESLAWRAGPEPEVMNG